MKEVGCWFIRIDREPDGSFAARIATAMSTKIREDIDPRLEHFITRTEQVVSRIRWIYLFGGRIVLQLNPNLRPADLT